jgi:hypothetical protein
LLSIKIKIMKTKLLTIIITGTILFGSCKKITEGLNTDPNQPTDAPLGLLLDGAQVSSILVYEGNLARTAGLFSRSFTGSDRQYISLNSYITTAPDYDDTWDNLYAGVITQAKLVESKAAALNNKRVVGIAKVMQAQAFGLAADLWGDVPFSEVANPDIKTPKFDTQAAVYAGVQKLLDDAITNLNANVGASPSSKDIFFGGTSSKWIETAYTLKARFYLHTKQYDLAITAANNGISSPANNMLAPHGASYQSDFNVYYSFLTYDRSGYMTGDNAYLPSILDGTKPKYRGDIKTNETARFEYFYQSQLNSNFLDPNVLCGVETFWGVPSSLNGFFGANTSFPLVTFSENQLIIAESQLKKGSPDPVSALDALNKVRAYLNTGGTISSGYLADGYKYLPYLITDFAIGGIQNQGTLSVNQSLLNEIIEEKYVSLYGQIEQFTDVRRTKNLLGITPVTGTVLPQRFLYPQSELNTNSNTPKLVTGDLFKPLTSNSTAY